MSKTVKKATKATKAKTLNVSALLDEKAKDLKATPAKTAKPKTAKTAKTAKPKTATKPKITKEQKVKLDTENTKKTVKMTVESQREIKYKYPEEIIGQLERKSWRRVVRAKLTRLEAAAFENTGTPGEKDALQTLKEYRELVLMVP